MDPLHQDADVRAVCKNFGVVYQAYSSLGNQWRSARDSDVPNPVLKNAVLRRIAAEKAWSVPMVVLRWQRQLGLAVIPASRSALHQRENLEAARGEGEGAALTDAQMLDIAALDKTHQRRPDTSGRVTVTFVNTCPAGLDLYWRAESGEESWKTAIGAGEQSSHTTYHRHVFLTKAIGTNRILATITIDSTEGPQQEISLACDGGGRGAESGTPNPKSTEL